MACCRPSLTNYIVRGVLQLLLLTCFSHVSSHEAFRGLLSLIKPYIFFLPFLRLLLMVPAFLVLFKCPGGSLICFLKPSPNLSAFMARLRGAPIFVCACSINAACFGVLLLVGLGFGAPHWSVLIIACFLPSARDLACLLLGFLLPQCLFVLVRRL